MRTSMSKDLRRGGTRCVVLKAEECPMEVASSLTLSDTITMSVEESGRCTMIGGSTTTPHEASVQPMHFCLPT